MVINSPCFTCAKRAPSCHDRCEEYKEYRNALDEDLEKKKAYDKKYKDAELAHIQGVERWKRYQFRTRRK